VAVGTQLGRYRIESPLGAGGMGQVYKARDTRLGRSVAIKIAYQQFSQRFEREARALSALNHEHICTLYDVGPNYLVMELVEGDTLAALLRKGALPIERVLRYGVQIADALAEAHSKSITHRDLKPANVMITKSGVKVLDFGLAKLSEPGSTHTQTGAVMGTPAYMAPEQLAGKEADARTDIYALGLLLCEMATGKQIAQGLPLALDGLPDRFAHVVERCLAREPDDRWQTARDVKAELDWAASRQTIAVAAERTGHRWLSLAAAAAVALAIVAMIGWLRPRPPVTTTVPDLAFMIVSSSKALAPVGDVHATPEISPDGSAVIFYADGVQLRRLNKLTPEPVRSGGFRNPGFWSPDSRSFAFTDGANLKKIAVPDGAPEIVANDVATLVGGSWSDNGAFLLGGAKTILGLYAVPAAGGEAKRVEGTGTPDGHPVYWPEFLPGTEDFLFLSELSARGIEESEVYLATLRDGHATDPVLLMKNATAARYTPASGGRILFVRNDNLYAQTLNRKARRLEGAPELVQQRVASSPAFHRAHFSVSRTGVVAWRPGTAGLSQVTIFDRQGREIGTAGSPTVVQTLKLAPDETRLLIGFNATAWLLEPGRPGKLQLEQGSRETLWSPDGSKFLDAIPLDGERQRVMERPVNGEGTVRELAKPPGLGRLEDISPDSKTLLLSRGILDTAVFAVRLAGSQKDPKSLVQTGETISHARFSPDGRWIVYTASSAGGGRGGVYSGGGTYVQPYPGPGLRKQVSSSGNYPVWRKDGREIVYLDEYQGRNYIWSVPVAAQGEEFRAGTPSPLFPARLPATTFGDLNFLAVSRDGTRFYVPQAVEQPDSGVIYVRTGGVKP